MRRPSENGQCEDIFRRYHCWNANGEQKFSLKKRKELSHDIEMPPLPAKDAGRRSNTTVERECPRVWNSAKI
jgi:hypothetical protein